MSKGFHQEKDPTGEIHAKAGSIGGSKTAQIPGHMAKAGSIGGAVTASKEGWMKEIGRKGGLAKRKNFKGVEKNYSMPEEQ